MFSVASIELGLKNALGPRKEPLEDEWEFGGDELELEMWPGIRFPLARAIILELSSSRSIITTSLFSAMVLILTWYLLPINLYIY